MAETEISARDLEAFARFVHKLPHGKDIDLVILKAHLLLEEQVNAIVRERLRNPDILLDDAGFESVHRIRLAQSFFEPGHQEWMWKAVEALNALRNRVAHQIDPKCRDHRMAHIVSLVAANTFLRDLNPSGVKADDPKENPATGQKRFEFALWALFEAVSSLVEPPDAPGLQIVSLGEN